MDGIILTALNAATAELEEERGRLRQLLGQIVQGVDEKQVLIEGPVVGGQRAHITPAGKARIKKLVDQLTRSVPNV